MSPSYVDNLWYFTNPWFKKRYFNIHPINHSVFCFILKWNLLFLNLFATGLPLTRPQGCCEKPDEGRVHLKMCVWLQASRRQFQELLSWKTAVQSILTWREVTTSIWQDVASCWGGSIALRDCWRMRLRQMFVTRSCNFWEWGPAFAQTPSFSLQSITFLKRGQGLQLEQV